VLLGLPLQNHFTITLLKASNLITQCQTHYLTLALVHCSVALLVLLPVYSRAVSPEVQRRGLEVSGGEITIGGERIEVPSVRMESPDAVDIEWPEPTGQMRALRMFRIGNDLIWRPNQERLTLRFAK
jgi:hypothetical protein